MLRLPFYRGFDLKRIASISNGGGSSPCTDNLIQYLHGKTIYNSLSGNYELENKIGIRNGIVQGGKCLNPDTVDDKIDFGVGLANEPFKYWNGVATISATVGADGKFLMTEKMGHIYRGVVGAYTDYWVCDSLYTGGTIQNCIGTTDIQLEGVNLTTILVSDQNFEALQDKYGYSVDGDFLVPIRYTAALLPTSLDVLGAVPDYIGQVKYNVKLVNNNNITFTGTEHLTLTLEDTATVVESVGTATPTISTNRIDFTAGTMDKLVLSTGDELHFCEEDGRVVYNVGNITNHAMLSSSTIRTNTGNIPWNNIEGYNEWLVY